MENLETKVDENLKSSFNDGYLLGLHKSAIAYSLERQYTKIAALDLNETDMLFKGIGEGIKAQERNSQIDEDMQDIKNFRDSNNINNIDFSPELD